MNSIKYFTQVTDAQIFAKHNLQLSNLNFTMKPASFNIAILSFFSRHGLYFHPTKDRPRMRPASTFLYFCCNFGQIFCTKVIQFFFLWKIWDMHPPITNNLPGSADGTGPCLGNSCELKLSHPRSLQVNPNVFS